MQQVTERHASRWEKLAVAALLLTHAGLLAWGAWRHSPAFDEVAYLPAGISHWEFGRFDLYCGNPPLVRMVAALPVLAAGAETDWSRYSDRAEYAVGRSFMDANGQRSFWLFTLARWACIPFSLLGGYVCFRWARELYGAGAGLAALALWCFCPNMIGNGQLMTPDMGATALGFLTSLGYDVFVLRDLTEKTLLLLQFSLNAGMFALLADMINKRGNPS